MRSYQVSYRNVDTGEVETIDVEVEDHEGENEAMEVARGELTAENQSVDTDEWDIIDATSVPSPAPAR